MISNLFGANNFAELLGTPSFWYTMVILIGLVVLLVVCIKNWNKGGKFVLLGLFAIVYTGLTIFSGLNINEYYTASGGIYGAITGIFDTNEVEVVDSMEFKLTNMELTQVGDSDTYSATILVDDVFELDKDTKYMVYVNDMPCTYVENSSDYVLSNYKYTFYDDNFNVILTDTLNFRFAFYTNSTSLKVTTNGGSEALKYWHHYYNKNTFIVKISEVESLDAFTSSIVTGDTSNYRLVSYSVDGVITNIQVYLKGQKLNLLDCADGFNVWLLNDDLMVNDYIVTENITLVAEKYNNVKFIVDSNEYSSFIMPNGKITQSINNPIKDGFIFKGWSINGIDIVDIVNYNVTSDVNFIALFKRDFTGTYELNLSFTSMSTTFVEHYSFKILEDNSVVILSRHGGDVSELSYSMETKSFNDNSIVINYSFLSSSFVFNQYSTCELDITFNNGIWSYTTLNNAYVDSFEIIKNS